jgi:Zn-dependent peptidase ImmA (M78 family)
MPETDIYRDLPRSADWALLMKLKVKWRVSIAALLRRARTLDVMSPQRYVNAMKVMSSRGWRTNEPGDEKLGPLESPLLLPRALDRLADLGISADDLAEEAALPVDDIRRLIRLTRDPRPRVEL